MRSADSSVDTLLSRFAAVCLLATMAVSAMGCSFNGVPPNSSELVTLSTFADTGSGAVDVAIVALRDKRSAKKYLDYSPSGHDVLGVLLRIDTRGDSVVQPNLATVRLEDSNGGSFGRITPEMMSDTTEPALGIRIFGSLAATAFFPPLGPLAWAGMQQGRIDRLNHLKRFEFSTTPVSADESRVGLLYFEVPSSDVGALSHLRVDLCDPAGKTCSRVRVPVSSTAG